MNAGTELNELIEKYLGNLMNEGEKIEFEKWVETDFMLRERIEEHRELLNAFKIYGRRNELKAQIQAIHADNFKEIKTKGGVIIKMDWRRTTLLAACVAAISIITTLAIMFALLPPTKNRAEFRELRRDVATIRKSQTDLIKGINANAKKTAVKIPANYSGTGFAISSNGYILTSRHVVKDADSVFVEGNKGRFKARVVYNDNDFDLSVLKISDPDFKSLGNIPYTFRQKEASLGEKIFTLGYPREDIVYGEGSLSSETGYRGDTTSYQVSIPVNPGNSGGPVLDERGNLIGMVSGKQSATESAAFAVKSPFLIHAIRSIPADSLQTPLVLPKTNNLQANDRVKQLKKLEDYIFIVKVYNKK